MPRTSTRAWLGRHTRRPLPGASPLTAFRRSGTRGSLAPSYGPSLASRTHFPSVLASCSARVARPNSRSGSIGV